MYWIPEDEIYFPDHTYADENGILALGGDLSPKRLILAYRNGIFPWFNEEDPIIWWSPDPRFVLYPKDLKVSKSMRKVLQKEEFQFTFDTDFGAVVQNCQEVKRNKQNGTWITNDMHEAYVKMHELGFAHSVEVWQNGELVGGLYGVSFGKCFFGESMFAKVSNASKAGFITFVQNLANLGFDLIDCQTETAHLASLGAGFVSRNEFLKYLGSNNKEETWVGKWSFD
jgi:leucyl/phenylalanyl-tRNA--protein transferase